MSGSSGGKTAYHIIHLRLSPPSPRANQTETHLLRVQIPKIRVYPQKNSRRSHSKRRVTPFSVSKFNRTKNTIWHRDGKIASGRFAIAKSGLLLLFSPAGNNPLLLTTQERPRTICSSNLMQIWRDVPPATPGRAHFLSVTNQGAHLTRLHKV